MVVLTSGPFTVRHHIGRTQPYSIWRRLSIPGRPDRDETVYFCSTFVEAQEFVRSKTA